MDLPIQYLEVCTWGRKGLESQKNKPSPVGPLVEFMEDTGDLCTLRHTFKK